MHTNKANPVPWRSRRHPVFALLREEGRQKVWLARRIRYTPEHVRGVAAGFHPASAVFRARCAEVFGRDEAELFDQDGTSSASAHDGPPHRAGTAVRAGYAGPPLLSTHEEAPSKSA